MHIRNLQNVVKVIHLLKLLPSLFYDYSGLFTVTNEKPIMRKKEQLNSIIEICPVRNVIARFGNKWALLVILVISENEPIRYNELGRKIPDISPRILANTLRTLEVDGLVNRKYFQEVPPRVEYSLTDTGHSLVPIILQLTEWAQNNMKTIIAHRNKNNKKEE